jgi:tetratricopeptide (TPR) repeat protein
MKNKFEMFENRFFNIIVLSVILILTFILYYKTIGYSYQFDDIPLILNNNTIKSETPFQDILSEFPLRIVSFMTFSANYDAQDLEPSNFRIWNIAIHLINIILVYLLLLAIFKTPFIKDKYSHKSMKLFAVFITLIFALHPLQTQVVIYIYQRLASLVAMFYMTSLLSYIHFRLSEKKLHKIILLFLTIISTLLGMLSKENSFTIPLMTFVTEALLFHKNIKINWKFLPFVLAFIIIGIYLFFKFDMLTKLLYTRYYYTGEIITNLNYFYTQISVLILYFYKLLIPINQNIDYQYSLSNSIFDIKTLLSLIIHLLIITYSIIMFKKNRLITLGIAWFYITISIESSLIPIRDVVFEHRLYLPMFGFFLALFGTITYYSKFSLGKIISIVSIIFIGLLFYLTSVRAEIWETPIKLWNDASKKSPNKIRPFNNLGDSYYRNGEFKAAINSFSQAINNLQPSINTLKQQEAPRWYLDNVSSPYKNRGLAYYNTEQNEKALEDFNKYLEINYKDKSVHNDRANVLKKLKRYNEAVDDYTKFINAIGLDFNLIHIVLKNRAICYVNLKQYDKAINDYTIAIEKSPKNSNYYLLRGYVYYLQKKYTEAGADYRKVLELNPNNQEAQRNLRVIANLKSQK